MLILYFHFLSLGPFIFFFLFYQFEIIFFNRKMMKKYIINMDWLLNYYNILLNEWVY